jgi:hypothetical protein
MSSEELMRTERFLPLHIVTTSALTAAGALERPGLILRLQVEDSSYKAFVFDWS